jgi:Family of unknown function (DUF5335)
MTSRSIPRDRWRSELDAFSREHEGWRVDVRVCDASGQVRTEAHDVPLVGVSCDAPGSDRIAVLTGERTDDHLTHEIPNAVAIDLERGTGAERVSIRAADGSRTDLDFHAW